MIDSVRHVPLSILIVAFLLFPGLAMAQRCIVELVQPSVADAIVAGVIVPGLDENGRPDLNSMAVLNHVTSLQNEQDVFRNDLRALLPDAQVDYAMVTVFNGLVVSGCDVAAIRRYAVVRSVVEADTVPFIFNLDVSLDLISSAPLVDSLGGSSSAGAGIRIAVVDSPIDTAHPFFDPTGYEWPSGFPRGDESLATAKVIAVRQYAPSGQSAVPASAFHGTHLAGIAAGIAGTPAVPWDDGVRISGVAPAAYLLSYGVFSEHEDGRIFALEPEIMMALEDAAGDRADVILVAFSSAPPVVNRPSMIAFNALSTLGILLVAAAGNSADGPAAIGYPASMPSALAVGNVDTGRYYAGSLHAMINGVPDPALQALPALKGQISPDFSDQPVGPLPLLPSGQSGTGEVDGCTPFTPGAFTDTIALIQRGTCTFSQKVKHAAAAGARATIIYDNRQDFTGVSMSGESVEIPAVFVSQGVGEELVSLFSSGDSVDVTLLDEQVARFVSEAAGSVHPSSSGGPVDGGAPKPELAAPGVRILSSVPVGDSDGVAFSLQTGTSPAAAHVAGAAALIKQQFPHYGPEELRALLQGSVEDDADDLARQPVFRVGAGVLQLGHIDSEAGFVMPPSLFFGQLRPGQSATLPLDIAQLGMKDWVASWEFDDPNVDAALFIDTDESGANGASRIVVNLTVEASTGSIDLPGRIRLIDTARTVTVPFSARINADAGKRLLLLDMSFLNPELTALVDFYRALALDAGISADVLRVSSLSVPVAALEAYDAVVVFTGDDQAGYLSPAGRDTLSALASWVARGGGLVIAGQGPFRAAKSFRLFELIGAQQNEKLPFADPETGELIPDVSHQVHSVSGALPGSKDRTIALDSPGGAGDLGLVGDLESRVAVGMAKSLTRSFLRFEENTEAMTTGVAGTLMDPHSHLEHYPELDVFKGRVAAIGFGLERMGSNSEASALFLELVNWVSERITLVADVSFFNDGFVTIDLSTQGAAPVEYLYEFDNGRHTVRSDDPQMEYMFEPSGTHRIRVIAYGALGAADAQEYLFTFPETVPDSDSDADTDTEASLDSDDLPKVSSQERVRDCGCRLAGGNSGGMSLLRLLLGN